MLIRKTPKIFLNCIEKTRVSTANPRRLNHGYKLFQIPSSPIHIIPGLFRLSFCQVIYIHQLILLEACVIAEEVSVSYML